MLRQIRLTSMMVLVFFMFSIFSPYLQYVEATIYSSISGTVKDSVTGQGIADVEVVVLLKHMYVNNSPLYFLTKTDAQGKYIIEKAISGTYEVIAYPQIFPYVNIPQVSKVTVLIGKNVTDVNFSIERGGSVSGVIYKSDGITPLSNTNILIYITEGGYGGAVTDVNGRYTINQLPPSSFTEVKIMTDGFVDIIKYGVEIKSEEITEMPNITALTNKIISMTGIVKDNSNNLIKEAIITLKGEKNSCFTISNTDGKYSVIGLPEGTYVLSVIASGYSLFQANVQLNEVESLQFDVLLLPLTLVPEEILKELIKDPPDILPVGGIVGIFAIGFYSFFGTIGRCIKACLDIDIYNKQLKSGCKPIVIPPLWAYLLCEVCGRYWGGY